MSDDNLLCALRQEFDDIDSIDEHEDRSSQDFGELTEIGFEVKKKTKGLQNLSLLEFDLVSKKQDMKDMTKRMRKQRLKQSNSFKMPVQTVQGKEIIVLDDNDQKMTNEKRRQYQQHLSEHMAKLSGQDFQQDGYVLRYEQIRQLCLSQKKSVREQQNLVSTSYDFIPLEVIYTPLENQIIYGTDDERPRFNPKFLETDILIYLNRIFKTLKQLTTFVRTFSIARGFNIKQLDQPNFAFNNAQYEDLLEFKCVYPKCPFRIFFSRRIKGRYAQVYLLQCCDSNPHSHQLYVNPLEAEKEARNAQVKCKSCKQRPVLGWDAFITEFKPLQHDEFIPKKQIVKQTPAVRKQPLTDKPNRRLDHILQTIEHLSDDEEFVFK